MTTTKRGNKRYPEYMIGEDFWQQFWPQFWGGVAATLFVALLTVLFTYIARLHITRFLVSGFEKLRAHHFSVELSEAQLERLAEKLRQKGQ